MVRMTVFILVLAALFRLVLPSESLPQPDTLKYIVVIDAGSTGSRIHVYPYIPSEPLPRFLPKQEFTIKKKPGLSSFQGNPSEAGDSLQDILNAGRENIPKTTKLGEVPIFLVATAGLRKVQSQDANAADLIMQSVRTALSTSGFKFNDNWAQIITGVDEGLFGWVTVNYLLNNFDKGSTQTAGVFEMGGESVQLTYMPDEDSPKGSSTGLSALTIAGKTYNVFAHSWMGYGMEAAQEKFDHMLSDETSNPCYMNGDTRGYKALDGTEVEKPGTGNYQACSLLLKQDVKLAKAKCTNDSEFQCALDGLKIPTVSGKEEFYLIENFWYTANVAGFTEGQMEGTNYFNHMVQFGGEFCSKPFDEARPYLATLTTTHDPGEDEIQKECFCAAYIEAILKEGIGFSDYDNYKVVRNIDGADLDWALGYAIVQEETGVARGNGSVGYWVYGLVLLGGGGGLGYWWWKRRQQSRFPRYQRLNHGLV